MNLLALFLFMLSSLSMFSIVDGGGVKLEEDQSITIHRRPKIEFIQSTSFRSHGRRLDPAESASTSETAKIA